MTRRKDQSLGDIARSVAERIRELGEPEDFHGHSEKVIQIFERLECDARTKGDVFWELDNHYGKYYRYQEWHPYLRRVRNHPHWGPILFSKFN